MTKYDKVLSEYAKRYVSQVDFDCKKVLDKIEPIIKKMDAIHKALISVKSGDIIAIKNILKKLAGLNYFIEKWEKAAHAYRHNKRVAFRSERSKEYDSGLVVNDKEEPVKKTDKLLDAEADLFIAPERDLYYKLNSCVSATQKSITSCQSLIKEFERNYKKGTTEEQV